MLTVAYASSNGQQMNGTLLYIPFAYYSDGCIEVSFSDGLVDGTYLNPNQTYPFLLNGNQDFTGCVGSSSSVGCDDVNIN